MIAFTSGGYVFYPRASTYSGLSGLRAAIVNFPGLVYNGKNIVGNYSLTSAQLTKSYRGGIGVRGSSVYLVIAQSATVKDLAAIFIATGQDPAHVVEGSLGVTTAEVLENGSLYFSIYLPALVVGTVGGGTHLPTQQEALKIMGGSSVLEYSQIVGSAVLAGELSLLASLSEGTLATAHQKLGRKGK